MLLLDRIAVDPEICLGQPTIRGSRITVSVVLKMLAGGKSVEDVLVAYPELEVEDIYQAMQYAAWVVSDQIQPLSVAHLLPSTHSANSASRSLPETSSASAWKSAGVAISHW